jgi:glycosyltransferase involved in cell wall biosynthesis
MVQLSVCICTHNPRKDYLDRTLESLAQQTLPKSSWELLIIDNASSKPVKESFSLDWHPNARHLQEEKIGLTMARLRAIAETESPLLLFVDDDNVLSEDYLVNLLELERKMPFIGCFGAGVLEPEYEEQPKEELRSLMPMLALRTIFIDRWSNVAGDGITPWGAGLAVRRDVAEEYAKLVGECPIRKTLGRSGGSLLSGEDDEISWVACRMGYGKGLFVSLSITHLIASIRVKPDYLLKIARGHAFSRRLLSHLHHHQAEKFVKPSFFGAFISLLLVKRSMFIYHTKNLLLQKKVNKVFKKKKFIESYGEQEAVKYLESYKAIKKL